MAIWVIAAIVGGIGVPFYLRFLLALRGEWKRQHTFYLARFRPAVQEIRIAESKPSKFVLSRAA